MKKTVMLIILSTLLLFSGCMNEFIDNSPSVISKSLIARMQKNINTKSLEGFTRNSTFCDALKKIPVREISQAKLMYNSVLFGSPVVSEYIFDYRGSGLSLGWMNFSIMPDGSNDRDAQIKEILAQMDAALGRHKSSHDDFGDEYSWDQNNCSISMTVYDENVQDSGEFAQIAVNPKVIIFGIFPKCPAQFPYPFGTDIQTVYYNEKPSPLPAGFENSGSLTYKEGGVEICLQFITEETGDIRVSEGRYDVYLNTMGFKKSLIYFETLSDGLITVVGEPDAKGYGVPDVFQDESGFTYEISPGAQGLSAHDIVDSGGDDFWLDIRWKDISFCAENVTDAEMWIEFSDTYINKTGTE